MITFILFLIGLFAIIGIARYNEDDNLFWKLLVSFVGAYAAATFVYHMTEDKKQDKVVMIENAPMQVLSDVPTLDGLVTGMLFSASKREKSPKPAGKDSLFSQSNIILSKVHASPRGQPTWRMFFDDG